MCDYAYMERGWLLKVCPRMMKSSLREKPGREPVFALNTIVQILLRKG